MSFLKYLNEELVEGNKHSNDPQDFGNDYYTFTVPEDLYAIQVIDSDSNEIDTFIIKNKQESENFYEDIGPDVNNEWIPYFLKDKANISKWVLNTYNNNRDSDATAVVLYRGEDMLEKTMFELSDKTTELDISNWLTNTITTDFLQYSQNGDNWRDYDDSPDY